MQIKKKIRVVMVAPSFPLSEGIVDGGVQGASLYLCQSLIKNPEIDLTVIRSFAPFSSNGPQKIYDIPVIAIEKSKSIHPAFDLLDQMKAFKVIQDLSPDIVHFQSQATWAIKEHLPTIVTIHGIAERDVLFKGSYLISRVKYLLLRLTEGMARNKLLNIISISPYTTKFLGATEGKRIWNIPNPVADDFFEIKRCQIPGRIFSASRLIPLKNVLSLIKAFSIISGQDTSIELRLAGSEQDSQYGQECRLLVDSLGLKNRVKFLGSLSLEQMRIELSHADCFALCSYQENAPIAVAEAMAVGVPVVASRIGGLPWMVDDDVTGVLVDPENIPDIVRGLNEVLNNVYGPNMGKAGKIKAAKLFNPSTIAEKTYQAYLEVINDSIR